MKNSLILSLIFGFSVIAQGAEIHVSVRSYALSCGYYSNTSADFKVTYKDTALPWGSKVSLIYGGAGSIQDYKDDQLTQIPFSWKDRVETELPAVLPYTWELAVSPWQISARSSNVTTNKMDFVFEVKSGNGNAYFDNGGQSTFGYYEVTLPSETPPCVRDRSEIDAIGYTALPLSTIRK